MPQDNTSSTSSSSGSDGSAVYPFLPTFSGERNMAHMEPQSRLRANTWPINQEKGNGSQASPVLPTLREEEDRDSSSTENLSGQINQAGQEAVVASKKKNSARRNPWGNMSYADLIEKAIESVPDKRLTLSQIYDWLIQNVPYFKEKADSNSSAGWKNSVRHNLSLHNRFMRVQNETGTGKSSWWMVNQSAKFEKPLRRRAATLESKDCDKRKSRVRKVIVHEKESFERNGDSVTTSTGESIAPYRHLSVAEIRSRASSNASSYGCLSPNSPENSPTLSPRSWSTGYDSTGSLSRVGQDFGHFGVESEFSSQLTKTVHISDVRSGHGIVTSHSPFDGTNKTYSGAQLGVAIGNYHPMSTNGYYFGTQFPPIPEEPRQVPLASHFYPPKQSMGFHHNPVTTVIPTSGNVSGGGFTYCHTDNHTWTLPHDLEHFDEPVQSFDFDWEELLQQEATIERNIHMTASGIPATSSTMLPDGSAHHTGLTK